MPPHAPTPTPIQALHPRPLRLLIQVHLVSLGRRILAVRHQSKLLVALISLFLAGYAFFAFGLFYTGLRFIGRFPGLGTLLVERLLFLLFACLFGLLLISNLVIAYTNLFRNREAQYLLTAPVPFNTVFQWKFVESTMLASWAFLFLIAPLLAAYGLVQHVAWHFYVATPVLITLFIILPGAGGALCAVTVARWMDRRAFQMGLLVVLGLVLGWMAWRFRPETVTDEMLEARILSVIDQLLVNTRFAQFPWLPSYWLSSGVQHWAEGAFRSALFFLGVLLSYALLVGTAMATHMGRPFYAAASAVQSRASLFGHWSWLEQRRRQRTSALDSMRRHWLQRQWTGQPSAPDRPTGAREQEARGHGGAEWAKACRDPLDRALQALGLRPWTRALVLKDGRMFWRDTAQWGQTVLLFGLLTVYILNLRHFTQQLDSAFWIGLVSYLNLGACALNVATLTTRFVFPQISLEGRRIWLIGLAPISLVEVVRIKFRLAATVTLLITIGLTALSCHLLQLGGWRQLYFCTAIAVMTLTLNGAAIGLGTLYPNFQETQPSKIVSGFGGTFCLVVSFLYIVASVLLLGAGSPWSLQGDPPHPLRVMTCTGLFLLLSGAAGWIPFRMALNRLPRMEL